VGRCRRSRRAEVAIRAGTLMSLRRIVAVAALASAGVVVSVAAARVRLKAMTAQTSQAALALKTPEGRWASAEALRSAWTFSMIACRRWAWSAATVSRSSGVLVVKKAWKRQVSNSVCWPSLVLGLSSGMRRTMSRPETWSAFFFETKAVKGISATWALEIQLPVVSS
jgi:hypothetical protein